MRREGKYWDFPRRAKSARIIGLGLSALSFGSVLIQREASLLPWVLLAAWVIVWPQIAYFVSTRSAKPNQAEVRILLWDALFGGAWLPILAFNAVPCLIFSTLNLLGILAAGGLWHLTKAVVVMALGCLAATLVVGFEFQPASSMLNVLCTAPVLAIYSLVVGTANYDLARKLSSRTRELAEEVSRREAAQSAAQQAQLEAESADRAKSEFLSHMSHELRTPLNSIIGFSDAMAAGVGGTLGEKHATYVDNVSTSGQHLLGLINDILDLSKVESGKAEIEELEFDIWEVVDSSLLFFRERAAEAGIGLSAERPKEMPRLFADPRRVKQMLVNLVSNAVKFTPPGGRISVGMERNEKGDLVVFVADTGAGMRAEDIPMALSPYGQVDGQLAREGTGLGLPLVKVMAELHDGALDLESELGAGTTASVTFPASRLIEG